MTTETDLIISQLDSIHADVREIRETQKDQGVKINDLCTRTSLNEKELKEHVDDKVKESTQVWKVITVIGTIVTAFINAYSYILGHKF
jgi:hypothetical protein